MAILRYLKRERSLRFSLIEGKFLIEELRSLKINCIEHLASSRVTIVGSF
jgi:hypothetical protein